MILIGMMVGCDYTEGIHGVGAVSAMEILGEFHVKSMNPIDSLVAFKNWWDIEHAKSEKDVIPINKIRDKLRKLNLHPGMCTVPS